MRSQAQPISVTVSEGHTDKFINLGVAKGKWGEPTIYRHESTWMHSSVNHWTGHPHDVGDIFTGVLPTNDVKYTYVIKEYKDGWWKLEWPD